MCIYTPRGALPPSDMRLLHIDADDCRAPGLARDAASTAGLSNSSWQIGIHLKQSSQETWNSE